MLYDSAHSQSYVVPRRIRHNSSTSIAKVWYVTSESKSHHDLELLLRCIFL